MNSRVCVCVLTHMNSRHLQLFSLHLNLFFALEWVSVSIYEYVCVCARVSGHINLTCVCGIGARTDIDSDGDKR